MILEPQKANVIDLTHMFACLGLVTQDLVDFVGQAKQNQIANLFGLLYAALGLFLLPFGLPRRLTSVSHFGGRPRRRPCPMVRRSNTTIAWEI